MLKEVFFYRHIVPFNNVVVYSNHIFLNFRTFVLLTPTQSQTSSWTHIETLTNKTEIRDHSNAISRLKFHILLGQATGSDFETCVFIPVFCLAGNHGFGAEPSEENLVPLREEQDERGQPRRLLWSGSSVPIP